MNREDYLAGVMELYQGEVLGEGLFSAMLAGCARDQRYALALLLQLESEAKVRLRPFLWRLGLPLVEDEGARAEGLRWASRLGAMPWGEAIRELARLVEPYLERYRALEAMAPQTDKADVRFMVDHEVAVLRFAELAAEDQNRAAEQIIQQQLQHPWVNGTSQEPH